MHLLLPNTWFIVVFNCTNESRHWCISVLHCVCVLRARRWSVCFISLCVAWWLLLYQNWVYRYLMEQETHNPSKKCVWSERYFWILIMSGRSERPVTKECTWLLLKVDHKEKQWSSTNQTRHGVMQVQVVDGTQIRVYTLLHSLEFKMRSLLVE